MAYLELCGFAGGTGEDVIACKAVESSHSPISCLIWVPWCLDHGAAGQRPETKYRTHTAGTAFCKPRQIGEC